MVFAWPDYPFTFLVFIGWVPILLISEMVQNRMRFFKFAYLSMLLWNVGTTWWIWNSTGAGAVAAIIANSFLMCVPLLGYHSFRQKFGERIGYVSLVVFWLSFEYIHLNWQLSWPWLTLGNVFATKPHWVQWYEFTGVSGGSLWVLLSNLFIFLLVKKIWITKSKLSFTNIGTALVVIFLPFLFSFLVTPNNANEPLAKTNVVIVQPNIDPYNEKFAAGSTGEQIEKLLSLTKQNIDTNTRLVIWPETALPVPVWQNEVQQNIAYQPIFEFVNLHPQIALQTGIETFKSYGKEKATITARQTSPDGVYYDAFNASVSIQAKDALQFYNKSKLVPGVETLPDFLIWMGAIFEKFGGTTGGYGRDAEAGIFKHEGNPYITAPIICYESIYGEYVSGYVLKGANLLTIMTNDGWWGNTAGHRQHLQYARLRAIETRKWVARSANTGISAVINNRGDVVATRGWEETAVIKYNIPAVAGETFYVRNGALIFVSAIFLLGALLLYNFTILLKRKFIPQQ